MEVKYAEGTESGETFDSGAGLPFGGRSVHCIRIRVKATIPEIPGLEVSVDDVIYMPSLDAPDDRPFPFVYFITIRNNGQEPVTVRGRKWVVRASNGEVIVVEGDGVVGQFPRLETGGEFSYNSCHTVSHDSEASGAFFVQTDGGEAYCVRIPPFRLDLPQWV